MSIRKFSDYMLHKPINTIHLESTIKNYINEKIKISLDQISIANKEIINNHINDINKDVINKHIIDINKIIINSERHILKTVDEKNSREFWKFVSISVTGFGAVIGFKFYIKNDLDSRIDKLINKIDLLDAKINSNIDRVDVKIQEADSKIKNVDIKLDFILSSKSSAARRF